MSHKVGDFPEDNFEQKLLALKDTQESIQSLSGWCLKYQQQHKKVVGCWLHVLKKIKVEQRVTLFYLANDVIQYSKRKGYPFVESWATALQKATPLVREDRVKHKILRLFRIWGERGVYDEVFLSDLSGLLTAHTKKNSVSAAELAQDFQPTQLFSRIRKCKSLEEDTDLKLKIAKGSNIPVSDDLDALQLAVKDRRNGDDLLVDIDDGIVKLEAYTKALELEIKERTEVINVLEVSELFYENQKGEAKVVCNAYRNFGHRIKTLKRKLEELIPTLGSPMPSPDIDAPSPSSGSDLDMPEENKSVCYDSEKSFIGTDFVSAMGDKQVVDYARNLQQENYMHHELNMQYNMQSLQAGYDNYMHNKEMNPIAPGYYKNISLTDTEMPLSPSERHLNSDPYAYHSEGNLIEVINSSQNDHANDYLSGGSANTFLQNLVMNPPPTTVNPPLQSKIPGLESPTDQGREVFSFMESKVKQEIIEPWVDKPVTKYQSWPSPDLSWNPSQETPVSPPAFERESYATPVEYVDTNIDNTRFPPPPFNENRRPPDVALHGMPNAKPNEQHPRRGFEPVGTIPLPKHDIDDRLSMQNCIANRNLIALTNSPLVNDLWKKSDSDYRAIPMPPTPPIGNATPNNCARSKPAVDNIESVDMEMSDDEEANEKGGRHRKSSFKDDENNKKVDRQSQLMPPPNPWDMFNVPHLAGDDDGSSDGRRSESGFNKMMPPKFGPNAHLPMDSQRPPPLGDFSQFPMPVRPGGLPPVPNVLSGPNGNLGAVRFTGPPMNMPPPMPPPPPHDQAIFRAGMEFPRPSGGSERIPPNFRPPFNKFFPYGEANASHPPMFPPQLHPPPNNVNPSPAKDNFSSPYSNGNRPPYPPHTNAAARDNIPPENYGSTNVNTIEPLIKHRLPSEMFENNANGIAKGPPRTNLKEISLSNVLEKSRKEAGEKKKQEDAKTVNESENSGLSAISEDLFSDEVGNNNDNSPDDGEDLYKNIEETVHQSDEAALPGENMNSHAQNNNGPGHESKKDLQNNDKSMTCMDEHSPQKRQRTPFQGTVPKAAKLPMAPPNVIDDDERSPWPLMPVIDLSDEGNSSGDRSSFEFAEPFGQGGNEMEENLNASFPRRPSTDGRSWFGGGNNQRFNDRRFSSPMQTPPSRRGDFSQRRGRFSSPKGDFRPRGNFMNFGHDQGRNSRPQFNHSPLDGNSRGNFQNSPGMFSGRPQRPFRRGW